MFRNIIIIISFLFIIAIILPFLTVFLNVDYKLLLEISKSREFLTTVKTTFGAAFLATLISIIFGIPFAYGIVRYNFPFKSILEAIVDIPQTIPHTAAGIALLMTLGRNSLIGKSANIVGISFVHTFWGIVAAMSFLSFSVFVNAVKEGFKKIDPRYEKVARSLGATPFKTFIFVSLPMIKHEIITGSLLMWARSISEFGAVAILAYYPMTLSVLTYDKFQGYGLKQALAITALIFIMSMIIFMFIRIIQNFWKYTESR
ncbi:molybdate/tungstate transport system permease protein [Marinitoga hydrogenitolerans DSM 16785]|uniref:Molybdate/tungstate transport system permease protein n=1 Tax=Marinitoga hydrogenitolerans (strain DSM 16785 / JCM 12826 / AT1271) TaxID=1122195 RepID=A0A1M5A3U1_MARH1|nr:ABC transporter permease [Marinitoga hydrogenitolerans]SHF24941.1 molybdate/tungstate transport system permease protein [Marinitoga hydrogenitolerans DSM 16785]